MRVEATRKTTNTYDEQVSPYWMARACRLWKNSSENTTVQMLALTEGANNSGSKASRLTSRRPRKSKRETASAGTAPTAKATAAASNARDRLMRAWCGRLVRLKWANQPPSNSTGAAVSSK